jgi:uncharacterized protein (DUF952 family)
MIQKYKFIFLLAIINLIAITNAFASEIFYRIIRKEEWLKDAGRATGRLQEDGFISLLTWDLIEKTAQQDFHGQQDLLLLELKISTADPLLKWETVPESEASVPRYYAEIPEIYMGKIYDFKADRDGNFVLPKDLVKKRRKPVLLPGILVSKLLHYQNWQNTNHLYKIQKDNFLFPKVQLQWWYFDFFLSDSSTMVLAFIPQGWWDENRSGGEKKSLFMISHRTKEGVVKRFSANFQTSEIKTSADQLEIPSKLLIQSHGDKGNRTYTIQVHFPEVEGVFEILPTKPPYAPFPTGVMPGYLQTLISGAPKGSPSFSYVVQVPEGNLSGLLTWDSHRIVMSGQAYHEQGRLDDSPGKQGINWSWYHFSGEGWNIFGSPGTIIYVQKDDKVLRSGFHMVAADYGIQHRTFSSPGHAKILTGAEIFFKHSDMAFTMKMLPSTSSTLISYASSDPSQVWGTVAGAAQLLIRENGKEKVVSGRMLLETCSWEKSIPSEKITLR